MNMVDLGLCCLKLHFFLAFQLINLSALGCHLISDNLQDEKLHANQDKCVEIDRILFPEEQYIYQAGRVVSFIQILGVVLFRILWLVFYRKNNIRYVSVLYANFEFSDILNVTKSNLFFLNGGKFQNNK